MIICHKQYIEIMHDFSSFSDLQEENIENSESTEAAPAQEPPKPSPLSVAWTFFTTFFSSLIPQPPPAVNAN